MQRGFGGKKRRAAAACAAAVCAAALGGVVVELALRWSPMDPGPYLAVDASPVLLDRDGGLLQASLNARDGWCFPQDASGHNPTLRNATIAAEDQRFESHGGVDLIAIARAALQNAEERRIVSGASTITMQVVKLNDARPRSTAGKLVQAWDAIRLERASDKHAILTAYLNRAPYGYNLIGADAAARRFFGKSSAELTLDEAALLAGLPKAPGILDPLRHPGAAIARRNYVLERMREEGFITRAQCDEASRAHLGAAWHELPMDAPHLARAIGTDSAVRTTIDGREQRAVQALLKSYLKQYDGEITNAAAIVVEVESAEVIAYCGSADFFHSDGGQMDLARAVRSPGSALKPFVYALAMQKNRLYPTEMLLDDALDYGDYNPANYDGKYNGLISAEEALRYSLNVPAVQVLDRAGVTAAHDALRSMGITTLDRAPAYYGLGLTLGNCGIRLDELAAAYRTIAAMGSYTPLHYLRGAIAEEPRTVFREDVAAAIFDMLRQPLPKELPDSLVQAGSTRAPVAWKTGTSTGHHDAWAFVFNRHYVVGVWFGNAGGRASERLVGTEVAVPLAALVFRGLPEKDRPAWPSAAGSAQLALVCSVSGLPAGLHCPQTQDARLPKFAYLNRRCDVHQATVSAASVERWPSSARSWDLASVRDSVPLDVTGGQIGAALRITSPADRSQYILTGKAGADRIRLGASLEFDQPVHWYCDGRYLGAARLTDPLFLDLKAGSHQVACMVENGATDEANFVVAEPGTE